MKRFFYLYLLLGVAFALIINTQAFAAKFLYDDFSGNFIDGSKWNESEFVREVVGEQLVSKVANDTSTAKARNKTSFQNPSLINVIECDITVVRVNVDASSFARVEGRFYNTLNLGTEKGDVVALVDIGDRGNGLEAWWEVVESLDDEGDTWEKKSGGTLIGPGTLNNNTAYTTKIEYNGTNGFTFTVAGVSDSFTGPVRLGAAFDSYKGLATGAYGGLGTGYVSALFDNVYINNQASVYDDFETAPLNQAKWSNYEEIREIANGKLLLNRRGFDEQSQITLPLADYNTPYLETKVRIESSSQLSAGARGIARIQGHYYNDSRGPGSGQDHNRNEGNIWVAIRLLLEDNGNLKAQAIVERSDDANFTTWTILLLQDFSTPINFDTDYTLSIEFTGSMLILKCNDETISYPISTPTYTPFGEHRSLRSRVYLDDTESGYIKAQFDDVYVEQAQATYDATGEWNFASSNTWAIGGAGCDPDEPGTYFSTIIQTGNNVTLAVHHPDTDDDDTMFNGIVSGDTYYLTTTFGEDGGTQTINVIFTLSSETSGTGKVTWTWTDGVETCNGGSDITFLKQGSLQPLPGDDGGGGGGGCFIATAAYGSPMQPYVVILREFRDHILLKSGIGKTFVQFYYKYSPPMADFIAEHANMRAIVRVSLLPIVGMSWLAMKIGLVSTIALMLLFAFGLISLVRVRKKPNR